MGRDSWTSLVFRMKPQRSRWSLTRVQNKTSAKHMVFSAHASQRASLSPSLLSFYPPSLQVVCAQHSHGHLRTRGVHELPAVQHPGTSRSGVAGFHLSTLCPHKSRPRSICILQSDTCRPIQRQRKWQGQLVQDTLCQCPIELTPSPQPNPALANEGQME